MRITNLLHLLFISATLCFAVTSNAALIDRGGGLIYDTDLNITWLQDADYAGTLGLNARMTWDKAKAWADNLAYYDSVRDRYWDDWRLPAVPYHDSSCSTQYDGNPAKSYGANCTGNEMGHLYYTELGNTGYGSIKNQHQFIHIQTGVGYWLSDDPTMYYNPYWFDWKSGNLTATTGWSDKNVWVVRNGDVAALVPEPLSSVFFAAGGALLALKSYLRRRKA